MSMMEDTGDLTGPEYADKPDVHMLLKIVILGVIGFVSVFGNLIALGTLVIHRQILRTHIYIIVGGLAFADIIVTIMFVPEKIIHHLDKGDKLTNAWCKMYSFLFNSCQYISAYHLVVLAVLRAILLTYRAHYSPTAVPFVFTCLLMYLVPLLANTPVISMTILDNLTKQCVIAFGNSMEEDDRGAEELYTLLSAAFSFFLPLVVMLGIYVVTGYRSKRFFEDSYSPRERRLSKMITYLILCFTFCRLPYEMVNLLFFYQMKNTDWVAVMSGDAYKLQVWSHVQQYLSILSMLDQAFRPIIYATMSREFGRVYDKVINCTYCKSDEDDEAIPPRLRRRGEEIEEVMHTPLRHTIDIEDPEPEEIL